MKRLILAAALLGSLASLTQAMSITLTQPIVSGVTSSSQNVIVDLNAARVDNMSVTAVYSSATLLLSNFTDGRKSSATITPSTLTSYSALSSSDTLTVSTNSALVLTQGSQIINVSSASQLTSGGIIGSSLTINGKILVGGVAFAVGSSTNATAINIAAAINNQVPNVTATVIPVGGGTVTITCVIGGSFCNSYTITSSTVAISTAAGTTFTGGYDNSSFTLTIPQSFLNAMNDYSLPSSLIFTQGVQWTRDSFSTNTAVSISNAINNSPYAPLVSASTASSSGNGVLIVTDSSGVYTTGFGLTSSTGALTVQSALFKAGQDAASFTIQGVTKVANVDWTVAATQAATALNIMNAINGDAYLSTIIVATATQGGNGVVYATSTVLGINAWNLTSSTPTLVVSSYTFLGGAVSAVNTTVGSLFLPAHGYATGSAIVFSTTSANATPPGLLFYGTTYYAVVLDANDIQVASSYANATALPPVLVGLSTQTVAGTGTFRFTPSPMIGVLGISWYASDDDVNFNALTLPNNVTVSSVTFQPTSAGTSTYWDFGQINARYLELKIGGPTAGAYNLTVTPYGKSQAYGY